MGDTINNDGLLRVLEQKEHVAPTTQLHCSVDCNSGGSPLFSGVTETSTSSSEEPEAPSGSSYSGEAEESCGSS